MALPAKPNNKKEKLIQKNKMEIIFWIFFFSSLIRTRENPRVEFIEIDVADDLKGEIVAGDFPAEILN